MLDKHLEERFSQARRRAVSLVFSTLNPQQKEGILTTEGPLLLLAGAGSGKTTVLIHRIANLLRFGMGGDSAIVPTAITEDDLSFLESYGGREVSSPEEVLRMEKLCTLNPARPWEILAITFTNKAAKELKERLELAVGPAAQDVWAATFHSACVRILRREIGVLGFPTSFTIYDTDDSLRVIKTCLKEQNLDDKMFQPRMVLNTISRAKDQRLLADDYEERCRGNSDLRLRRIAEIYKSYERKLWQAGALDFDDIILHTVRILQSYPDVRAYYQNKFRYVLVDEYQDTNHLQYLLAKLLAGGQNNLCVVGDDDQSIYRFRGATIENIMSFEREYPKARVIRLEQNYRSTGNILKASNGVIANNAGRKGKSLWTKQNEGDKIQFYQAMNEQDEALHVASQILKSYGGGKNFRDHAVLYRMNAQSNQLEMAFKRNSIPYKVVGGLRFFDRAEIKDMLAYLWVLQHPSDDLRLSRIVNVPPRGIGAKALESVAKTAVEDNISMWEVMEKIETYPHLLRVAGKFRSFVDMMNAFKSALTEKRLPEVYDMLLHDSGYLVMLEEKKEENATRIENVKELKSSIVGYLENTPDGTLGGFLDEIALYSDLDSGEDETNCVTLMTIHAAKGLEFPTVFVVGLEEGVFPGFRAIGETEELEEERRLCYVAMTRAKEVLHLCCAAQRMLFGRTSANLPSRFVKEIPEESVAVFGRDYKSPNKVAFEDQWTKPSQEFGKKPSSYHSNKASYRSPAPKSAALPQFQKGDMVQHQAFGKGLLLSIQPMGGDALLEVAFDNVGTKRLMLKAAAQHMQKS